MPAIAKKTLLLNANYQLLTFVNERKSLKLLMKEKVEVIEFWSDVIAWGSGETYFPAIVRLKKLVKRNFFSSNFNRRSIVKRDESTCQYCNLKLSPSQITIDHVIPRAQGGINSFLNCVVACKECNNKKDSRTPEQAGMVLLRVPTHPSFSEHYSISDQQEHWFEGWNDYLVA